MVIQYMPFLLFPNVIYLWFSFSTQVSDTRHYAIMIAAPFSFTLGVLGSVFSIILGNQVLQKQILYLTSPVVLRFCSSVITACREYVWAYAAFEFSLVIIFIHLFYTMVSRLVTQKIHDYSFQMFFIVLCGSNTMVSLSITNIPENCT